MPQLGSAAMMLGVGQLELLRHYAGSREIPVTPQKAIIHLLNHEPDGFEVTPEVEEAINFVDFLSDREEATLTVREDTLRRLRRNSKHFSQVAYRLYQRGGGARSKLPEYYRNGVYLLCLLGSKFLVDYSRAHPKYGDYSRARPKYGDPREVSSG